MYLWYTFQVAENVKAPPSSDAAPRWGWCFSPTLCRAAPAACFRASALPVLHTRKKQNCGAAADGLRLVDLNGSGLRCSASLVDLLRRRCSSAPGLRLRRERAARSISSPYCRRVCFRFVPLPSLPSLPAFRSLSSAGAGAPGLVLLLAWLALLALAVARRCSALAAVAALPSPLLRRFDRLQRLFSAPSFCTK